MSETLIHTDHARVQSLLDQMLKLVRFDCTGRVPLSERGDELDALAAGLNALAEELDTRIAYFRHNEARINMIMDILMEYTVMNFSRKMPLSEHADELDAIAAGLNTLAEELEESMDKQKKYAARLETSNGLLSANLQKLNAIFNNTPDAIIATNLDTQVMEWNAAATRMYGYSKEEMIGQPLEEFIHTDYASPFERARALVQLQRTGTWKGELQQYTARRKKMILQSVITYLHDEKGEPIGYLGVNRDITEIRRTEEEVRHKTEELKRSNAELEQFAYVASHDLQEPLRMITSYVQLLEKRYKDKLDGDAIEFIHYAVDGAGRMQNLIHSLLDYSRINRVRPFEQVNLNEVMEDLERDLSVAIRESGATIHYTKLPPVYGDRVLIGQLFFNLVANAIKFRGEAPLKIVVRGEEKDDHFFFYVKDNGIGIQKEYFDKIFVIFQRLHTKDKYPGTGIGLAICKKIVEKHKGVIWVDSEPGKGTTFYFTIKKSAGPEKLHE